VVFLHACPPSAPHRPPGDPPSLPAGRNAHPKTTFWAAAKESLIATDHKRALREPSAYFENLATLVEAYEAPHYPIEAPDPIEAIRFRMEQGGLA
jgi:hypothetical protein